MTAPPMNGNGQPDMNPPEVPGNVPLPIAQDTMEAIAAIIDSVKLCAKAAAMGQPGVDNAGEAKDWMQAALLGAQAAAILDPNKTQTGTPLDHEIKMAQLAQQGALNLEEHKGANAEQAAKVKERAVGGAAAKSPGKSGGTRP